MKRHLVWFVVVVACVDPVHRDEVEALGPEVKGEKGEEEEGEKHRPGQPCIVCHEERGPGEPVFSVAGTVYVSKTSNEPAKEARVFITDATKTTRHEDTNEAGNFYIKKEEWDPVLPLSVRVEYRGSGKQMATMIRRRGDCGLCHQGNEGDSKHASRVYATGP